MNSIKKEIHDIRSWANIRETSIEIAEDRKSTRLNSSH